MSQVLEKSTQSAWSARSAVCSLQSAWSAFWGDPIAIALSEAKLIPEFSCSAYFVFLTIFNSVLKVLIEVIVVVVHLHNCTNPLKSFQPTSGADGCNCSYNV